MLRLSAFFKNIIAHVSVNVSPLPNQLCIAKIQSPAVNAKRPTVWGVCVQVQNLKNIFGFFIRYLWRTDLEVAEIELGGLVEVWHAKPSNHVTFVPFIR